MRLISNIFASACLAVTSMAQANPGSITGRFEGTGRACHGTLIVQAKTISWLTLFSQCKSMPYTMVSQARQHGQTRTTYRLASHPQSCRFAVLSLTHAGADEHTGWEVTGYGSEQRYLEDKSTDYRTRADDMMSCYLIGNRDK